MMAWTIGTFVPEGFSGMYGMALSPELLIEMKQEESPSFFFFF